MSYVRFDLPAGTENRKRVLLKLNGYNETDTSNFRFHVYAIPGAVWTPEDITWNNAPQLDKKEALITEVGQKSFMAGEVAFNHTKKDHYIDVTDVLAKHAGNTVTFALVRETRYMSDDEDKGKKVFIASADAVQRPELLCW